MLKILSEGFGLGIATGLTCLTTCSPIYIPFLLSEKRSIWNSTLRVMEISIGRFIAYIAFGALAGFTGSKISSFNREIFTAIAYSLISIYLLVTAYRTHQKSKKCMIPKFSRFTQSAFLLGLITGINFCPSFLLAISSAINLGGAFGGSLLFLGFFFGTTIYLIPLIFVGGISKIKKMQTLAKFASIAIGLYFLFVGIQSFHHYFSHISIRQESNENADFLDVFAPNQEIGIICSKEKIKYFMALRDSIKTHHNGKVNLFVDGNSEISGKVFFIEKQLYELDKAKYAEQNKIIIRTNYNITSAINHLKTHIFKITKPLEWSFE